MDFLGASKASNYLQERRGTTLIWEVLKLRTHPSFVIDDLSFELILNIYRHFIYNVFPDSCNGSKILEPTLHSLSQNNAWFKTNLQTITFCCIVYDHNCHLRMYLFLDFVLKLYNFQKLLFIKYYAILYAALAFNLEQFILITFLYRVNKKALFCIH